MSYDPALAQQPGIPFSTLVRDMAPICQALLPMLAQLATGCSNPLLEEHSFNNKVLAQRIQSSDTDLTQVDLYIADIKD